jgi:hypothetical protein
MLCPVKESVLKPTTSFPANLCGYGIGEGPQFEETLE